MIEVENLCKYFKVHRRQAGLAAAVKSIFRRKYETVRAVDGVSFTIQSGERVGFLGPNGAGKTTTLKTLSGLLHPSSGQVRVSGYEPRKRAASFLKHITLVMGQKQQLLWDLPPAETFLLNRAIFDVPDAEYRETMRQLSDLLDLEALQTRPTRQLSLGERMKCELAAALLHRPRILFLDEPTIGLDVSMQLAIREFIRDYNERYEATIVLTSHYMKDVTALCPRVIVIDRGRLIHDGDLGTLIRSTNPEKRVSFTLTGPVDPDQLSRLGKVVRYEANRAVLQIPREKLHAVVAHSMSTLPIADLSIEDPPLEQVMRKLFADQNDAATGTKSGAPLPKDPGAATG